MSKIRQFVWRHPSGGHSSSASSLMVYVAAGDRSPNASHARHHDSSPGHWLVQCPLLTHVMTMVVAMMLPLVFDPYGWHFQSVAQTARRGSGVLIAYVGLWTVVSAATAGLVAAAAQYPAHDRCLRRAGFIIASAWQSLHASNGRCGSVIASCRGAMGGERIRLYSLACRRLWLACAAAGR